VTAKGKLAILADSEDPQWKGKFTPSMDSGVDGGGLKAKTRSDRDTFAALKRILTGKHPRAVIVNFAAPDARGHAGDKEGYLAAIKEADGYVGELWTILQKDPFYAGKTALFVTNDHGRHLDGVKTGFKDHGCDCEGCRHIMLFAFGPDFKQGITLDTPREQIDMTVTAAELLGVKIPDSKGQVLTELFAARDGKATTTKAGTGIAVPVPTGQGVPAK
jgi:phosphopentomutase